MRVLWFAHRDMKHPKAGGAERTIDEVGKRLAKMNNEIHLVSVNPGNLSDYEIVDGIIIHRIRGNIMAHLFVPKMIKKIDPDVIIDDLGHAVPWISSLFTNKNVIVFFRHLHARSLPGQVNLFLAKIITLIEKNYRIFYKKNIFVTESYTSIEDLIGLGIKKENIIKIPPGVNSELFHPGKKSENFQLIYFGGMRKYKRPELAIKVYEMLYKEIKDLKLIIIGDGPMLNVLKNYVKGKNYNITFTGRISDEELAKLLRESWVNLHFSVTEGWGYSIMESSASGTPTVALKAPGVVETIIDGYNGFLVENIDDFKEKILKIIENEEQFSKNARKFAENFSWDKTAELWYQLLLGKKAK